MLGQDVQDSEGETERTEKDRERESEREKWLSYLPWIPPQPKPKGCRGVGEGDGELCDK